MNIQELEKFPRKYRSYFTSDKYLKKDVDPLWTHLAYPYTKDRYKEPNDGYERYIGDVKKVYADLDRHLYDAALKIVWLEHRFGVGPRSTKLTPTSGKLRTELNAFMTKVCMVHRGMAFAPKVGILHVIKEYAERFHPGFYAVLDPFKSELAWPYHTVSLSYLLTVADMDEALGLLKEADDKHMTYNEFMDFVTNWVACFNEKYGEKYQMTAASGNSGVPAHVINIMDGGSKSSAQLLIDDNDE